MPEVSRHQFASDLNNHGELVNDMLAAIVSAAAENPGKTIRLNPAELVGMYGTGEGQYEYTIEAMDDRMEA